MYQENVFGSIAKLNYSKRFSVHTVGEEQKISKLAGWQYDNQKGSENSQSILGKTRAKSAFPLKEDAGQLGQWTKNLDVCRHFRLYWLTPGLFSGPLCLTHHISFPRWLIQQYNISVRSISNPHPLQLHLRNLYLLHQLLSHSTVILLNRISFFPTAHTLDISAEKVTPFRSLRRLKSSIKKLLTWFRKISITLSRPYHSGKSKQFSR